MEKIRDGTVKACTSGFTFLELLDKEQEYALVWHMLKNGYSFEEILRKRSARNLNDKELDECFDKMNRVFTIPYKKHIDFYYLNDVGWDKAVELMHKLNLTSNDSVHLATAIMAECDLLISNDQNFLENAQKVIKVTTPENIDKVLSALQS
jgi:predicted nucleic acid-binding protein